MSFVQAKCPECGGFVKVNNEIRLDICKLCGKPFVVAEAIQCFNETVSAFPADTNIADVNNEAAKELPLEKNGNSATSCKELSKDFPAAYKTSDSSYKAISYDNICKEINDDFVIEDGVLKKYTGSASEVTIPYGVTSIGYETFLFFENLTSITIPESVTNIGDYNFYGCDKLSSISVDDKNNSFASVAGVLFNKDRTILVKYPEGKTGDNYIIPDSVISIGVGAFSNCENLTSITIPDSVKSIGYGAFSLCENLTSITIPNSVTSIGAGAFDHCEKLTSITIPDSVTSIGRRTFEYCKNLTSITIPNSVKSIGYGAFVHCKNLCDVKISEQLLHKSKNAFSKELYERIASKKQKYKNK